MKVNEKRPLENGRVSALDDYDGQPYQVDSTNVTGVLVNDDAWPTRREGRE